MRQKGKMRAFSEPDDEGVQLNRYEFEVQGRHAGKRLDVYVAARFPEYSRTFIQALIRAGAITVNGKAVKPSHSPSKGWGAVYSTTAVTVVVSFATSSRG